MPITHYVTELKFHKTMRSWQSRNGGFVDMKQIQNLRILAMLSVVHSLYNI